MDIFGVKVSNNNVYILIQDTQQQASRQEFYDEYYNKKKQCEEEMKNECKEVLNILDKNEKELKMGAIEKIDRCLFFTDSICSNDVKEKIREARNFLRVLFDFPADRIYYIVVKVVCANAESKYQVFKITRDSTQIKVEMIKNEKDKEIKEILEVVKDANKD
ncbi:hypothetical protein J5U22_01416 [Saccharolobus shibatae]|uniref:Uncharacterized protein n=1 Tax=Saccharolobus shibatae TaxID=2286 RepID=A0A8F5C0H7_9CREN|nr:hypothetical protein J5U22_01416 [Saccharolobus shibatae]